MDRVLIMFPFYDDHASIKIFLDKLEQETAVLKDFQFSFLLINDGSPQIQISSAIPLTIISLQRNLGHQKAIAIGLSYAAKNVQYDKVVIMDCDGEDEPADLRKMLNFSNPDNKIIVAKRLKRQESLWFQFFYKTYKFFFLLLTGEKITFGNFMMLHRSHVATISHHSEIWNHLAGAVIKSRLPYSCIDINRGKRYAGESKMNFTSLLLHGLGAIGVFIDVIAARLLLFSLGLICFSIIAIVAIFLIKFFTQQAIPGWATTAVSSMLIVLLQSFLLSLFTIFLYLSSQGQRKFIPALHFMEYIKKVDSYQNA